MNKDTIDKKVKHLLKNNRYYNLQEIASNNNIIVLEYYLGDNIGGFYFYVEKTKLILINSALSESHKQIVLSHELGHATLHPKLNSAFLRKYTYLNTKNLENEANYFACVLLKEIGIMRDDCFCIYSNEILNIDENFIQMFKKLI